MEFNSVCASKQMYLPFGLLEHVEQHLQVTGRYCSCYWVEYFPALCSETIAVYMSGTTWHVLVYYSQNPIIIIIEFSGITYVI